MTYHINETHNPELRSWVKSANTPGSDFPIQNLPFGVFKRPHSQESPSVGVAIGDSILDVNRCLMLGRLTDLAAEAANACRNPGLNQLLALGPEAWSALRQQISQVLRDDFGASEACEQLEKACLVNMAEVQMVLPAQIGDYTDFYASVYHATNVGSMFRPDNPLLPNYKHIPIGYHGRASSIFPSGTPVRRPKGQTTEGNSDVPTFGPCRLLDYELEVGFLVGPGNESGTSIPIHEAERHIFGVCLVNDWSARDIQKWEYQPLGPFLAKSFATTITPWIVTLEALAPFRIPAFSRPETDPMPLEYLMSEADQHHGGIDLQLEVWLQTETMRTQGIEPVKLSHGNFRDMYWTIAQMLTHHASNGCNLRPGDLMASGTVSGTAKDSRGCLLELTWRGAEPITLPTGEVRRFLQDGDEVMIRGYCERDGFARIGLGECRGVILPAGKN